MEIDFCRTFVLYINVMADYSSLTLDELKELCVEREIPGHGSRKRIISRLVDYDAVDDLDADEESAVNDGVVEDEVTVKSVSVTASPSADDPTLIKSDDSTEIIALKLQLAIARENRLAKNMSSVNTENTCGIGNKNLRGLLPKMSEFVDDILGFFKGFENTLKLNNVEDQQVWARLLPGCLNSRTQAVYGKLDYSTCQSYVLVKKALLESYKLDARFYLHKFRTLKRVGNSTYKQFVQSLADVQTAYLEAAEITTYTQLLQASLLEQFICTVSPTVKSFILARKPVDAFAAAELADLSYQISQETGIAASADKPFRGADSRKLVDDNNIAIEKPNNGIKQIGFNGKHPIKCFNCSGNHKKVDCPLLNKAAKTSNSVSFKSPTCFTCGLKHATGSPECKGKKPTTFFAQTSINDGTSEVQFDNKFIFPIFINHRKYEGLRDTGCEVVLLKYEHFIDKVCILAGECLTIEGVGGQPTTIPVAMVQLNSPCFGQSESVWVKAGLVRNLKVNVLIGNQIFHQFKQLQDIISCTGNQIRSASSETGENNVCMSPPSALTVITRSRAAAAEADCDDPLVDMAIIQATPVDVTTGSTLLCEPDRSEVRETDEVGNRRVGDDAESSVRVDVNTEQELMVRPSEQSALNSDMMSVSSDNVPSHDTEAVSDTDVEFRRMAEINENQALSHIQNENQTEFLIAQKQDPTLTHLFDLAKSKDDSRYFTDECGILYRRPSGPLTAPESKRLCVPARFRQQILENAHNCIWSAHNARDRMSDRISTLFFWPSMYKDIAMFCRNCRECQLISKNKKSDRLPMCETEIITEIFSDLSVDVCGGDFPLTALKNKYLLVVQCNASKMAFAFPVSNLRATTLANKLLNLFATIGIPKVIRFDSAAQWKGSLMTELTKSLGVHCKITSPFLHHGIGGVERLNATLEKGIKIFMQDHPRTWDRYIHFLLFAYNSVPSATTGTAPQTYVYGRLLRSPLDVMREVWLYGQPDAPKMGADVIAYLTELREQLQSVNEFAETQAVKQSRRHKLIYDRHSTARCLAVGDKCMVLIPTSNFKLFATWSGPYAVTRRVDEFNYELDLGHRKAILHINLLKKFHEANTSVNTVVVTDDAQENQFLDALDYEPSDIENELQIGGHLSLDQKRDLISILDEFSDVLTDKIGCTDLIEHVIKLTDEKTIPHQPIYKVPDTMKPEVEHEIEKLLKAGIIVESDSVYASPIVCVRKSSGKLRICGDFRQINKFTRDDPYIMNSTSEIISKVAGAKFLTRIDANSAFLQIPLSDESCKYAAIRTFCGTYEYKRCCFGLKNSSKTYQRLVNKILRGAHTYAIALLDDICIFSDSLEQHLLHIRDVLQRLRNAHLTINKSKCLFILEKMNLFGFSIENGKISPTDEKTKCINELAVPTTKTAVKSLLGLVGYYSHMIPDYQEKAYPLTQLLKKDQPEKGINWGPEQQQALEVLKQCLVSKPILSSPDPSKPYILQTDASRQSVSAILAQRSDQGLETVISYASRKLLPRETNYSVIEIELLAVIMGVMKFHHLLYGAKIILQSDHRALSYLTSLLDHSPRLARWHLILSNYDIEMTYKAGKVNSNADGLSRL